MEGILAAGFFVFSIFFGVITFALWGRIILRYLKISAIHPINQLILKITNPIVSPVNNAIKSFIPSKYQYDIPCFLVLITVEVLKFLFIGSIFLPTQLPLSLMIIYPIADIIIQPLNLICYAIFIRVIMSWINPGWRNPLNDILFLVTEPLLRPIRDFTPPIAGFDFSPFIVFIIIKVITIGN